jgi:hypothetical protein
MQNKEQRPKCAFCRDPISESDEETLVRLRKGIERKDPQALCNMAVAYRFGTLGLPVDQARSIDLFRESSGLGCSDAQSALGDIYHAGRMGLEPNEEEGLKYFKEAAEGGDLMSRHNLGYIEEKNGNRVAAMRHYRLSASGGYRISMEALIEDFENGKLRHGDLAETLQAFYLARAEMKSVDRDEYIEYMKRTGQHDEVYEC